jgi:hypothetical protein
VLGSKSSFKSKTAGKWSLYHTFAIKDDPGSTEGVNKDHKAQISLPTPQGKSVTSVGMPTNKKVANHLLFIAYGGPGYSVF